MLGERGHDVVLFEAGDRPGGQLRLAASNPRRADLIQIVDWRLAECRQLGVDLRLGTYAEAADVLAERPDLVIVATGGLPDRGFLTAGQDLVSDTWDVMTGSLRRPRGEILVYDDHGGYPAMDAVEVLTASPGVRIEYVTPERTLAPDVGSMNSPPTYGRSRDTTSPPHSPGGCAPYAGPGTGGSLRPCTASTPRRRPSGPWTT